MDIDPWFLEQGVWKWIIVLFHQGVIFESLNHGQFNTIQGPWVKDNATYDHDPLSMAFSFK